MTCQFVCTGNKRALTENDLPRVEDSDAANAVYHKFIEIYDMQNTSPLKMLTALFKVNLQNLQLSECEILVQT